MKYALFTLPTLLLVATAPARAASDLSYFNWQADAGAHVLTPSMAFRTSGLDYARADTTESRSRRSSGSGFGLAYAYGLDENTELGVGLQFINRSTTYNYSSYTNHSTGLTDPRISLLRRARLGNLSLIYGAHLHVSPGPSAYDSVTRTANGFSGGHSISPQASLETALPFGGYVGGLVQLGYQTTRHYDTDGRAAGTETGDRWGLVQGFFEKRLGALTLGTQASLTRHLPTQEQDFLANETYQYDATTDLGYGIYSALDLSPATALGLGMSRSVLLTKDVNRLNISASSTLNGSLSLRTAF
jgi:hypothetical protein